MKSCLTAVVLLIVFFVIPISAQEPVHLTIKSIFRFEQDATITSQNEASALFLNPSIIFKNLQNVSEIIIENFPVSNSQSSDIKLSLAKSIIDNNTQLTIGKNIKMNLPVLSRFTGKIINDANSEVFVTLIDNTIYCRIKHGNGEDFFITPLSDNINEYKISSNKDNISQTPIMCSSVEPHNFEMPLTDKSSKVLSSKKLQVDIALDVCKEWFLWKFKGDTIKIRDYILAAYSMVAFIYEKEMNIKIYIPWMRIATTTDVYNSGEGTETNWAGEPSVIYENIPNYWKNNNLNVKADLVHAVVVGGRGGIASLDALSTKIHEGIKLGPFAVVSINGDTKYPLTGSPFFNFDFDVHTIAHELGHNFNCPHTHSCSWNPPIDTCVVFQSNNDGCPESGTDRICTKFTQTSIMSYCREINNWVSDMTFLARPAYLIRTYAEKYLKEAITDVKESKNVNDLAFSIVPNPLTNVGFVKYSLKSMQKIRLSLYNSLGKEVAVLFSGIAESGEYTANIITDVLPTGMYQVVCRTGTSTTSLPISIVK